MKDDSQFEGSLKIKELKKILVRIRFFCGVQISCFYPQQSEFVLGVNLAPIPYLAAILVHRTRILSPNTPPCTPIITFQDFNHPISLTQSHSL